MGFRLSLLSVCGFALATFAAILDHIDLTTPFLIPESMDYVQGRGYIIGSVGLGGTWSVSDSTGTVAAFVNTLTMNHTFGIEHDKRSGRNRLLVCVGPDISRALNPNAPFQSAVAVIDLNVATPTLTTFYDLSAVGPVGAPRMCNDIVSDAVGNIYATDSFGAQVWKITPAGAITTFISNPEWVGSTGLAFGTDGIEYTKDGNLIVGHISDSQANSTLWLVTTGVSPTSTLINITGGPVFAPDGIYFGPSGCLYVVGGTKVHRLASTDNWVNAQVLESVAVSCTTPTAVAYNSEAGKYFVSCSNMFNAPPYVIEVVTFTTPETTAMCSSAILSGVASFLFVCISLGLSTVLSAL